LREKQSKAHPPKKRRNGKVRLFAVDFGSAFFASLSTPLSKEKPQARFFLNRLSRSFPPEGLLSLITYSLSLSLFFRKETSCARPLLLQDRAQRESSRERGERVSSPQFRPEPELNNSSSAKRKKKSLPPPSSRQLRAPRVPEQPWLAR